MAVLGRLLLGSAERLDLPDLLAIDSYTAADFKYLIQTFIGGDKPYVLKGFDVIQPQDSIGTENVSIRVADSVVYYPASKAGTFYYGLPEGSTNTEPLVPELRKNATNFVYLTFDTFDTAQDSRAFWDPDQNGGAGGEFSQDVNTESVLSVVVNVSVSTFPDNTIPICKVTVGSSVIESIQDCRDLMFRLGGGGVSPNPFSSFNFRNDPSASYARNEPNTTMTSALDPNPFQGGDKNLFTLKEWMDVVMTKLKEISGTTYWYEVASGGGGGGGSISINNVFTDALASTLKSKGQWQHSSLVPGQATWTEDIHYLSLRDPRDLILRAATITLADEEVAWIEINRDVEINNSSQAVAWQNASTTVNGVTGAFVNLAKGDWVKKKPDSSDKYLRVEEFYALPNLAGGTTTPALAQSIRLSANYAGTTGSEIGEYTKGEYLVTDVNISTKTDAPIQTAGGNFFWIAYRSDTALSLASAVPTQLTIDITEADGQRARVTSTVAHGLVDGDRVTITTGPYAGTWKIEAADTDDFYIETTITGNSLGQTAFYAVVTTAARSTPYSYSLETANHGFQSDEHITIQGTSSLYDGSYLINVRSPTSVQIAIPSLIANPGAIAGQIVVLPRMNVRTEFGTVKIVQGEDVQIGDADSKNILTYIGMDSLAQQKPNYYVPAGANMLRGYQNYNSEPDDSLTIRAARLTAMMADRVQDRGIQIIGRTNITSITAGANQEISALGNLTLVRPSSPDQALTLTAPIALPANSAIVADMDRDGSAAIVPTVISLGSQLLLEENRIILFYRFAGTTVYNWKGDALYPYGHLNTELPEDSQNRNVYVFNPGQPKLNAVSGLLLLDVKEAAEVTRVTTIAGASVPQSSYFTFAAAFDSTEYYVWYNVNGGGVDPAVVGKTGIMVAVALADTASQVASATMTAINTAAGADVTATVLVDVVTITNDIVGPATDAAQGTPSTTFTIQIVTQGFDPDIDIIIPGSADNNTIDVEAINTLGTLVIGEGQAAWVRINRFAAKTFNTVLFADVNDTDGAGAIYVTDFADVPVDQDVFILWSRIGNNLLETHHAQRPEGNVYDETLSVIPGTPSGAYEIQGPVAPGTELQLPPDSRDGGSVQEYIVGSGQLEIYLNGQYLRLGDDWSEVGPADSLSKRIIINQELVSGDYLMFRIDANGAVYFAAGGGGGATSLQDAYDGGRFITVNVGQPIVISGASGKLLSIQGDLEVTGVIDPAGITFSQEASDPLDAGHFGIWRNASDEFIFKRGAGTAINLNTDFIRRDGTLDMLADLDLGGFKITNLAAPTGPNDAARKADVDDAVTVIGDDFLRLDGTNPMEAILNMDGYAITNLLDPIDPQDAATMAFVELFLKRDGTLPMTADLDAGSNKLINVDNPTNPQDASTKAYTDLFLKRDGTLPMTAALNMDSFRINNLLDPADPQDAATKAYVDDIDRYTALYLDFTNNTGSTIVAGSVVMLSQTVAGEIILADASAVATAEAVVGVVVDDILNTQSGKVQIAGRATVNGGPFNLGKRVFLSLTAGEASSIPPTNTGETVFVIGVAADTNEVVLWPHLDNVNENVYEEPVLVVSGAPADDNEITGPVSIGTEIDLPLDSRAGASLREYVVGKGLLEVYLNGQLLKSGEDYDEVGAPDTASSSIEIQQTLEIGDELLFRINLSGGAYFSVSGGASSLQDAYNNGNTIVVSPGIPVTINGASGKLLVINGDIEVTGVIDPAAIQLTPQASSPLPMDQAGLWVSNTGGALMFQNGDNISPATNVSDAISGDLPVSAVRVRLLNDTGSTLAKFTPVRVDTNGDLGLVDVAIESSILSVIGLVAEDIDDATVGDAITLGCIKDIALSAAFGDVLYISKTGGLTNVKPSIGVDGFQAGDFVIKIGIVSKNQTNPSNKDVVVAPQVIGQL